MERECVKAMTCSEGGSGPHCWAMNIDNEWHVLWESLWATL